MSRVIRANSRMGFPGMMLQNILGAMNRLYIPAGASKKECDMSCFLLLFRIIFNAGRILYNVPMIQEKLYKDGE